MILTDGEVRMMSLNERLTYKPRYIISIGINPGFDFYNAVLTFQAPNTSNPNEPMIGYRKEVLGKKVDVDTWTDIQICEAFVAFILRAEEHEIKEWIKLDGVKVLDPHLA